ncbi:PAS domain S-box-containing protein [Mucilaginibacter pineti]|uniref:histidine kinase n=1 Tax=Mucilaginibacter pineti TaxID=1391627 RepID=A0A1G7LL70_9SPHI|nr:PAS domain S-box protein [Mucilaginibacter pineti]SDF50282.1 PAS domain S-box-containing protein [Mucilaginibacter pineti]
MHWKLNRYRFLLVPAIVLVFGLAWAFFADPAITYLARNLDPERQDTLRWVNDVLMVCLISAILAVRIRKQQYALARSEEEYRRLFEANPNPMWIYDHETLRFLRVNNAAVKKYGYPQEHFLKMTIYDIRPTADRSSLDAFIGKEHEELVDAGVWQHVGRSGEVFDVSITSHPVEWAGRPCKVVMASDLTPLLKKKQQLREAYQKLKASNEALLRVAWSNSHELRKPLCSVIALSDLLHETVLDNESREIAGRLKSASEELDAIVRANNAQLTDAKSKNDVIEPQA